MAYNRKDGFFQKAQKEGFAARSIYKLEAIDERFKLIRKGDRALDLGSAPGSWLQYLDKKVGERGLVVGIDLKKVRAVVSKRVRVLQGDIRKTPLETYNPGGRRFDVIVSDMAPNTSGIRSLDQERSAQLTTAAFEVCARLLKPGGNWCAKAYQGESLKALEERLSQDFERFERLRPPATRKNSFEIFLIGIGYCGALEEALPKGEPDAGWSPFD
jgi:23S rRNA (uridine2552-2'-O)-methyltransferase